MVLVGTNYEEALETVDTCKHCDLIDIVEPAIACAFETSPEICDENLSTLIETSFSAFEPRLVSEAREIIYQQVDQSNCRAVGFLNTCDEASMELLDQ